MNKNSLLLVGAGKMGGALLHGWIEQGISPQRITVIEANPDHAQLLKNTYHVQTATDIAAISLSPPPETVILAVKPQQMAAMLESYVELATAGTLFISIAAGKETHFFSHYLGANTAIIRAMPNLPATIQKGATVLYAAPSVTEAQRKNAEILFNAAGKCFWIEDEAQMDAVTALSGSGPAYVFLLAECMTKAGEALGLPSDLAEALAEQTIFGSAKMLAEAAESADILRTNVTSPGGTTEAALNILMDTDGMQPLLHRAMEAACKRSIFLANG